MVNGHLTLPENICGMDQMGCTTHDQMFIWAKPHDLCEFETIRTIEVTEESGYLVDRHNKIVLKKGALVSAGTNSPARMITHTNFHNLFLAAPNMKFPPVSDEADIATYVSACDDYILFEGENLVIKQKNILQGKLCRNQLEERGQQLIRTRGTSLSSQTEMQ